MRFPRNLGTSLFNRGMDSEMFVGMRARSFLARICALDFCPGHGDLVLARTADHPLLTIH